MVKGRIRPPPKRTEYPSPLSNVSPSKGMVIAQEKELEELRDGEYMRIMELVKWDDGKEQLRFGYYYRKKGEGDNDWVWGQSTANMSLGTFKELLKNAKENPDFKGVLKGIEIEE